ncbi:hypothetical protein GO013_00045 [Pseudodesulfovibrio sp. JC047]|uniref:hypothetical protein n=1 Tax=Pseudodesulfovibrio sp. JC047 TaxID=2683199 RepID=UPI0013D4F9FD|nr:hypothetical protein [Pseudodesulfovibrio sp. JC047]NDV17808.1 hypothetical protein [Pseudodesulfovibrio sp. JC047]
MLEIQNMIKDASTVATVIILGTSCLISLFAYFKSRKATKTTIRHQIEIEKLQKESLYYQQTSLLYQELASQKNHFDISRHHQKTLIEVSDELRKIVKELTSVAGKAYQKIYEHFDNYDPPRFQKHLRHNFHDITEVVKDIYDPALDSDHGMGIISRLQFLTRLDEDFEDHKPQAPQSYWHRLIARFKKCQEPSSYQEELYRLPNFYENVAILLDAFSTKQSMEMYSAIYPYIDEFLTLHANSRDQLEKLEKRLKKALEENGNEPFDLLAVPNLGFAFLRKQKDISKFLHLRPVAHYEPDNNYQHHCIPNIIYAGSVLRIVRYPNLWGQWQPGYGDNMRSYS